MIEKSSRYRRLNLVELLPLGLLVCWTYTLRVKETSGLGTSLVFTFFFQDIAAKFCEFRVLWHVRPSAKVKNENKWKECYTIRMLYMWNDYT